MIGRRFFTVALVLFVLLGCPSPLMEVVEEEVKEVTSPPVITSHYPDVDAVDVAINSNVSVSFSKQLDSSTVGSKAIEILTSGGTAVTGSFSISSTGDTITFTPTSVLLFEEVYAVHIKTALKDKDGNNFESQYSWTFTTGLAPDTEAPVLNSILINSDDVWTNSKILQLQIDAVDNRSLAQMNISSTSSFSDSNWTSFSALSEFEIPAGEGERAVYVKVKDSSGNTSVNYVTDTILLDTQVPLAEISVNSGKSATNDPDILVSISALEELGGSGAYQYRLRLEGEVWPDWIDLVDGIAPNIAATIAVPIGSSQYIEAQVSDVAGNESDITVASILYENSPPIVSDVTPVGSSVPGNTTVATVHFSEEMNPLSIDTTKLYVEDLAGNAIDGSLAFYEMNSIPNSYIEISGLLFEQFNTYVIVIDATVEDIAGNAIGEEKRYEFATGSAVDSSPPEVSIWADSHFNTPPVDALITTLANGLDASNYQYVTFSIEALDDYNGVKDMKIWEASQLEPAYSAYATSVDVDLDPGADGAGIKYLHYKFRDWALNENSGYVQVVLDVDAPTLSFQIDGGATHTTSTAGDEAGTLGAVQLDLTADDILPSGVKLTGVTHMVYSEDYATVDTPAADDWVPYENYISDFVLSSGNGSKTVYVKVKDYLNLESAIASQTIVWDTEPPVIDIGDTDYLEVNIATAQPGAISDNTDASPAVIWSQVSGPGAISFDSASNANPVISADTDGVYELSVSVTDAAGNESSLDSIGFIWDQTAPSNITAMNTSAYDNTALPEWSWAESIDGDYYKLSFNSDMSSSWDITNVSTNSWAPDSALSDGSHTLYIEAWDNAGNKSASTSSDTVVVDTINPVISDNGRIFLTNAASQINVLYDGTDGSVTEGGSGISSILWENVGPGTITFGSPTALNTTIDAAVAAGSRALFDIQLTVADNAGNSETATFTIDWDKEAPPAPLIGATGWDPSEAKYHTPDLRPVWSWTSNGGSGWFKYRLDGGSWSAETQLTSYIPPSDLSQGTNEATYTHVLEVIERDDTSDWSSGNWSVAASLGVWIDGSHVSAPGVSVDVPSVTNDTSFRWAWTSGAGTAGAGNLYRFTTDNWATYANPSGATGDAVLFYDYDAVADGGQAAQTTVNHTFKVEEYHAGEWRGVTDGKYGTNTVTVDLQGPVPPAVSVVATTNDITPTWSWYSTAGSDGTGYYRYQLDGGGWSAATTQTAYTPAGQAEGSHTLEVQERDALGNWSVSSSAVVNVDLTPPTLNSITINGGASYTNSQSVTLTISATYESGLTMSILDYYPVAAWEPFEAFSSSKTVTIPSGEGTKYVYVRLKDVAGNICSYKYDYIIMDTTPPSGHSITLNGGAYYTPSYDAYFDAAATDNYSSSADIQVQHAYYAGSSYYVSSWEPIGTGLNFDSKFTNAVGTKYVYARFKDGAGNLTTTATTPAGGGWVYDTVYMQIPSMRFAHKGYYSNGLVNVYYNEVTDDANIEYVNRYYVYSTTNPNADPNVSTSGFTYEGYADQAASSYKQVSVPTGELRWFWVRAYNSETGGYGYFTPSGVLGFSSNVTVIYDPLEATDVNIATYIKALLEDTYFSGGIISYGAGTLTGTIPVYSVTLLPELLVDNTTYSTYNRIYGDPVIMTPGVTLSRTSASYDIRVRNIASSGKGIIAMGAGGGAILDRIEDNWSTWGLSGTAPTDIGTGESMGLGANASSKTVPYAISNIWHYPLYNNYLYDNYRTSSITLNIFTTSVTRRGAYLPSGTITDGAILAADPNYSTHMPVVRQGRFMQYGYYDVPGRGSMPSTMKYQYGQVFFINLVALMDNY